MILSRDESCLSVLTRSRGRGTGKGGVGVGGREGQQSALGLCFISPS